MIDDFGLEVSGVHRAALAILIGTQVERAGFLFFLADDEHVGDFLQCCLTDFVSDFFAAVVDERADASGFPFFGDFLAVGHEGVGDGQKGCLNR